MASGIIIRSPYTPYSIYLVRGIIHIHIYIYMRVCMCVLGFISRGHELCVIINQTEALNHGSPTLINIGLGVRGQGLGFLTNPTAIARNDVGQYHYQGCARSQVAKV